MDGYGKHMQAPLWMTTANDTQSTLFEGWYLGVLLQVEAGWNFNQNVLREGPLEAVEIRSACTNFFGSLQKALLLWKWPLQLCSCNEKQHERMEQKSWLLSHTSGIPQVYRRYPVALYSFSPQENISNAAQRWWNNFQRPTLKHSARVYWLPRRW